MLKKIILLYPNFFFEKDYKRFGVKYFINQNIIFEVWNILPIFNKNIIKHITNKNYEDKSYHILNFENKYSLKESIKNINHDETAIITTMQPSIDNKWVFECLEKCKIKWGQYLTNLYPEGKISLLNRLKIYTMNSSLIKTKIYSLVLKLKSFGRSNYYFGKNYSPFFFIFSGNKGKNKSKFFLSNHCKKISTHTFAMNEIIENNREGKKKDLITKVLDTKYIVYLDEDVPNHKDPYYHGYNRTLCDKDIFFSEINNFFEFIEEKTKCKVIVAAYPKSSYSIENNPYNREIFFGKTLELIRNAQLVLQHNTTAVNYSIIFEKPILFLTSKNYLLPYRLSILHLANELKMKAIDISSKVGWKTKTKVDNKTYEEYFDNYISSNIAEKDKSSYEIIYENLSVLFKN